MIKKLKKILNNPSNLYSIMLYSLFLKKKAVFKLKNKNKKPKKKAKKKK